MREAQAVDVPALLGLWEEFVAHEEAFDPDEFDIGPAERRRYEDLFVSKLSDPGAAIFVAEDGGRLVGYTMGWKRPRILAKGSTGYVNDVFVTEGARRQGVGTALVRTILAWFQAEGVSKVDLYVYAENEKGKGLYDHLGFRAIAHRLTKELE